MTHGKVIQQKICNNCKQIIDIPSVHFMCGHSYHKNCIDTSVEGCPYCNMQYEKQFHVPPAPSEEDYFKDMKNAKDGFEVNANYIGKRLFSKPAVKETERSPEIDLSEDAIDSIPMETLVL